MGRPVSSQGSRMTTASRRRWRWYVLGAAVVALAVGGWALTLKRSAFDPSSHPPPFTVEGSSEQLQDTVFVPTLDAPIPEGKSAVWCASFQFAWNRLRDDVARGPVQLTNAQSVADRLNAAAQVEGDLNPDAVFAAAGLTKDGIVDRVRTGVAKKFPDVPGPDLSTTPAGAVAYAYLAASAKFDIPFFDNDSPLPFTDAAGRVSPITAFGIRDKDAYAYHRLREQVEVLYRERARTGGGADGEFVLDPCKTSQPYQVVVARVGRKATLADTLADVEAKAAGKTDAYYRRVGPNDTLLVPNLAWRITHRFKELEGPDKRFLNAGLQEYHLDAAEQTIQFRLDRSGAELAAEAKVYVKPVPSDFHVNRPFLVYMKKRGGVRPFFVAWVGTAELLEKK